MKQRIHLAQTVTNIEYQIRRIQKPGLVFVWSSLSLLPIFSKTKTETETGL